VEILPPLVCLPVSECSQTIRLLGLVPGAQVHVFANGRPVVDDKAKTCDQTFDIDPPAGFNAGEIVKARQDFPTETSDLSPDDVQVLASPSGPGDLRAIGLVSTLYLCGQALWLDGAFPGAKVEVTSSGVVKGSALSPDGNARIELNSRISAGETLAVRQTACGLSSGGQFLPKPDTPPVDGRRQLTAPTVGEPLFDCQFQLPISGVVDGATVTIHRAKGDEVAVFDLSSLTVNLVSPLRLGEKVSVFQALPGCEFTSPRSDPPAVVQFENPPAPFLNGPICKRDRSVKVSGLISGATVMFLHGQGQEFAYGTAWAEECDFPMPDLSDISTLSIKQRLCADKWSNVSNTVTLDRDPPLGDLFLKLETPLVECGRRVHVRGCAPGVKVFLHSKHWGGQIGWAQATDYETDVDALLPLVKGDAEVWVTAKLCGEDYESPHEDVGPLRMRDGLPDVVTPVHDCGGFVHVHNVIPGASVEVYVNSKFAGRTRTAFKEANVPVDTLLQDGDLIKARQSICEFTSEFCPEECYVEADDMDISAWPSGIFSERICQMTGRWDPVAGHAHLNDTSQWGVFGTDLGINFEHGGTLYIYFGDEGIDDSSNDTRDADPIFFTNEMQVGPAGFHIHPILQSGSNVFRRLEVLGQAPLGNFEVPTGGFSFNGQHHVFVSRRNPKEMQRSLLAKAANPRNGFNFLYWVDHDDDLTKPPPIGSANFINIAATVIRNEDWASSLPANAGPGLGLLLFGSGRYRGSGVCLAWAPLTIGSDPPPPTQWQYFDPKNWWGDPGVKEHARPFEGPAGVGELSVNWVPQLRRWVILSGQDVIRCHYARHPTGPWHTVAPVFDPTRDGAYSVYMHKLHANDGLVDRSFAKDQQGTAYGPYLIPRFTKWNPWTRTATLFYFMSTHIPYQVMLMKFQLRCH